MAWTSAIAITIDHTKVANTDQVNFPVLVSGFYSQLATLANGGSVTNDSGFDIIFAQDSLGVTPIPFERVVYQPLTGACEFWVLISTLSHTVDTVFYILLGNSAITTDQQSASSVWDSNFVLVDHAGNPGSYFNVGLADSTSNNNTGSVSATPGTGKIGGCYACSSNGAVAAASASLNVIGSVTMEAWVYPTSTYNYQCLIVSGGARTYGMYLMNGTTSQLFIAINGNFPTNVGISSPYVLNAWNHVVVTADGTSIKAYLNGLNVYTLSSSALPTSTTPTVSLGYDAAAGNYGLIGSLDECRISKSARSADWITTCFNSQSSPSAFYSTSLTTGSGGFGPFIGISRSMPELMPVIPSGALGPFLTATNLAGGIVGTAYSETIFAQGGASPYVFGLVSGTLPAGTTLNTSTGIISGTPATAATYSFTLSLTDSNGFVGTKSFVIIIATPSAGGGGGSYTFLGS